MSEATAELGPEPEPTPARRRSWAWLAWLVIAGICSYVVFGRTAAANKSANGDDRLGTILLKVQGRYLVGAEEFLRTRFSHETAKSFGRGTVDQRLRYVVLAGELAGPREALEELQRLDKDLTKYKVQPTAAQAKVREILRRLYRDYDRLQLAGPSVPAVDRTYLRERLNWFGALALAPGGVTMNADALAEAAGGAAALVLDKAVTPDPGGRREVLRPALHTFEVIAGGFVLMLLLGLGGFAGAVVLVILAVDRKVQPGVQTGISHGGIYAETFAVWLCLFFGVSVSLSKLSLDLPPLLLSSTVMLASLLALAWPVVRGIRWSQVRQDIGLTPGRQPGLEPLLGIGCYAMALPLVAAGLVVTLVLLQLQRGMSAEDANPFAPSDYPTHPIIEPLSHGGLNEHVFVFFLAAVVAPLVEETMFRGVLYRHLREASARFGRVVSVLASAILVSFVFAVIHPQGIVAVPVLMALAFGFALAREWRGTLIPGMVGHGLNNVLVMLILSVALGD
jgi:membrane protease YdiL (CAAX protease family)